MDREKSHDRRHEPARKHRKNDLPLSRGIGVLPEDDAYRQVPGEEEEKDHGDAGKGYAGGQGAEIEEQPQVDEEEGPDEKRQLLRDVLHELLEGELFGAQLDAEKITDLRADPVDDHVHVFKHHPEHQNRERRAAAQFIDHEIEQEDEPERQHVGERLLPHPADQPCPQGPGYRRDDEGHRDGQEERERDSGDALLAGRVGVEEKQDGYDQQHVPERRFEL